MSSENDVERFFPESFTRSLDEAHEARAEMSHVEALLGDWGRVREWLRDEAEDEAETYRGLKARRAELLERTFEHESARDERAKNREHEGPAVRVARRPLVDWGDIVVPYPPGCPPSEGSVPVPAFLQERQWSRAAVRWVRSCRFRRPTPGRRSEPHYQGVLRIPPRFPLFSLSNWVRNWRFVIQFPCALCDSRLTYRVYFEEGGAFDTNALSAGLWNWINVREIPDVSAGIDFGSLPDYEVWPIDESWPFLPNFMADYIWDGVTVQGSMGVQKGKAPVIALIVGVIVGVAGGMFRIFNAGFHPWGDAAVPAGWIPAARGHPISRQGALPLRPGRPSLPPLASPDGAPVLEGIKLNHDPVGATTEALNIRRNKTASVTAPDLGPVARHSHDRTVGGRRPPGCRRGAQRARAQLTNRPP